MANQPYGELWRRVHNLAAEFQSFIGLEEVLNEAKDAEEFIVESQKEIEKLRDTSSSLTAEIEAAKGRLSSLESEFRQKRSETEEKYEKELKDLDKRQKEKVELLNQAFATKSDEKSRLLAKLDDNIVMAQRTLLDLDTKINEQQTLLRNTQTSVDEIRKTLGGLHG